MPWLERKILTAVKPQKRNLHFFFLNTCYAYNCIRDGSDEILKFYRILFSFFTFKINLIYFGSGFNRYMIFYWLKTVNFCQKILKFTLYTAENFYVNLAKRDYRNKAVCYYSNHYIL